MAAPQCARHELMRDRHTSTLQPHSHSATQPRPGAQPTARRGPCSASKATARAEAATAAPEHCRGVASFGWPPFMVLLQLGSCASSGRAWLLRAAQVGSARTATAPTTARHQTPPAPPPKPPQPYALSPDRPMQARERELSPGRLDHARARAARHAVPAVPGGAPQVHRGRGGRTLT